MKHELDETYVYRQQEVDAFARAFYTPAGNNWMGSHARLQAHLQPARDRFRRLSDDQQAEFTDKIGAFVNLYAFLSQIIPYSDSELEQLSTFGRALLPYLRADRQRETVRLGDAVELEQLPAPAGLLGNDPTRRRRRAGPNDGLGTHQLAHPKASRLRRSQRAVLKAPFPTTTVVGLSSVATAMAPMQHGVIGFTQ